MAAEMAEIEEKDNKEIEWSTFEETYVPHLVRQLTPFGSYNIVTGGNHGIINATSGNYGPSWRMVVELDPKGPKAVGVYPGGQSGNPGSTYYDNFIESWALGNYLSMQLPPSADGIETPLVIQTLNPKPE